MPCAGLAVYAAVYALAAVGKAENMVKLLLGGGYAAGIFAEDHIYKLLGKLHALFLRHDAVPYDIYRYLGVNKAQSVYVKVKIGIYFDYILAHHAAAWNIFYKRNGAVQTVQPQQLIYLHCPPCVYMINDYTVSYGIHLHFLHLQKL